MSGADSRLVDIMAVPDIAALLAPTWQARARADNALIGLIMDAPPGSVPWPEPVQAAVRALQPSPQAFLSALVAFWADVSARVFARRMRGVRGSGDATWPALDPEGPTRLFPMTPAEPPTRSLRMGGLWVWGFIERLGPIAALVEAQLVDCLEHPERVVCDAAERALLGVEALSDAAYRRFLAVADLRGRNGMVGTRLQALARHANPARLALLLEGLAPSLPAQAQAARFGILAALQGALAQEALAALIACIDLPWPEAGHAELIGAIDELCKALDVDPATIDGLLPAMRLAAASDAVRVRSSAAAFLARHACAQEGARLLALAADPHPWVRGSVARGLMTQRDVPTALLRALVASSLGDYSSGDGQPHDCIVELLLRFPTSAEHLMPDIVRWWDATTAEHALDREPIQQAMRICDALAAHVDTRALLPGLERALAWLTAVEDEVELPGLDEPGAVPVIRNQLEADLLAAGTSPEQAAVVADLQGAVLDGIAAEIGTWQAQIDAEQADFDAEMRELYPELATASDEDQEPDGERVSDDSQDAWTPEPDELVEALQAMIARLHCAG